MSLLFSIPYDCNVLIETGLGHGRTAYDALQETSADVITIERDLNLITRIGSQGPRHVIIHGSSPVILPRVCDPEKRTTFWLDAHYSAGAFTGDVPYDRSLLDAYGECPLLAELAVIKAVAWKTPPVIYIDDAICFQGGDLSQTYAAGITQAEWPTDAQIRDALPDGYVLTVEGDGRYFCGMMHGRVAE